MIYFRFALRLQKAWQKLLQLFFSVMKVEDGNLGSLMLLCIIT